MVLSALLLLLVGIYVAVGEKDVTVSSLSMEESAEVDSFLAHLHRIDNEEKKNWKTARRDTVRRSVSPTWMPRTTTVRFPLRDSNSSRLQEATVRRDSFRHRVEKYPEGTVIDLNDCDTTELKKIPGIGRARAAMIVAYRQRLGGYSAVTQLQELESMPDSLNRWFRIGTAPFRKLSVNVDGLERLRNHPYMDFYKAKAILEFRRKRGRIKNLSQLSLFKEFTEKDLQRLSPYLSFE